MGKVLFLGRLVLGLGLIFFVGSALSAFGGAVGMMVGTALMLGGLLCGYLVQKHRPRWFFMFGLIYGAVVFALNFVGFPWYFGQYFAGGYVVYFACAMISARKSGLRSGSCHPGV